ARAAERGLFDFLLVVEGADGRGPEPLTVLNALAGVTEHIGLAAAVSTAGREPRQLVRRFAALDQLSAGRAGGPAAVVSRLAAPRSEQSRPVVIQEDADPAAEVVLAAARGRTRPGVKVLARFEFTLTGEADPEASPEDDPAYALADRLDGPVRSGALDGYVLVPDAAARGRGLDAFVARVVPLLQGRGSLRTAYRGTTLRDHLGL
ncbi:MAG: hypothetical protein QOF98_1540, partial [Streptomyces sp.]|nr:hypothetical protein [Streptomyces sp.]